MYTAFVHATPPVPPGRRFFLLRGGATRVASVRGVARASQTPPTEGGVSVRGLSKTYALSGQPLPVLQEITFDVQPGEFVSFVGPSGSGKSTLLNILAGLEEPDRGVVTAGGSARRLGGVAYMPQRDVLLPWRSALENAILGLEVKGVPRHESRQWARELFAVAGLGGFEDSLPSVLSGGMRQRVAFLRTVLTPGSVMLLDEPFGALDALTRSEMHEWLLGLWEHGDVMYNVSTTVVLVTHDVEEALLLSDRVYVLSPRPGRIRLVHEVSLPRPRTPALTTTEEFVRSKAALLAAVRGEGA
ncbi:MAG: ABC transporter ATP-binding protein [Chloroflexota bacterium]|nr:ABC transporter ATP-binding protein [Chloroflexota bacterium]